MAPNKTNMKTKSSAKTSSGKNGKLASLKGVAKALFSGGSKAPAKGKKAAPAPAPVKAAAKSAKVVPVAAAVAKGTKATPKKPEPAPKAAAGKAVALAKGAKAAAPAPAPAKAGKGKGGSVLSSKLARATEEICREVACEALSTSGGYCRLHYVKNWKKIKRKELILKEGKLNQYIEELVSKYPDKYIEAIRQDLAEDKAFAKVIYDLELDESVDDFDVEGEGVEQVIDTIKRDFDDEGETF